MPRYTSLTIIYNPNSTGPSHRLAQELKDRLQTAMPKQAVRLVPTERAGHAEELAYEIARASRRALVISASGDGGYHEVVNGLMKAQKAGVRPIAGLLPAGNANDHYNEMHESDLVEAIRDEKVREVDLLKLAAIVGGKPFERYAHSYIGVGLTPKVGQELNKARLNWFNEILITARVLLLLRPIRLVVDGKEQKYDSLILSNIHKMSKILTISKKAANDDGRFEVTALRRRNKIKLIMSLLRASTKGLVGDTQVERYSFRSLKTLLVQLDGEIAGIDPDTEVTVTAAHKALPCII